MAAVGVASVLVHRGVGALAAAWAYPGMGREPTVPLAATDVSGAQWSAERLNEMADTMERLTWRENADALRAFARVVDLADALDAGRGDA